MDPTSRTSPIAHLSNDEIVVLCYAEPNPTRQIYHQRADYMIVRIQPPSTPVLLIKLGLHIKIDEYHNQVAARKLIDQTIVKVPQAYRFFTHSGLDDHNDPGLRGFIVMEFMEGIEVITPDDKQIDKSSRILTHFFTIQAEKPGSLTGGAPQGLLWQHIGEGVPRFDSVAAMEKWFNFRFPSAFVWSFYTFPLVLCHLDLAPRNILWQDDGCVVIIDWESAGFYPRFFEAYFWDLEEEEGWGVEWMREMVGRMGLSAEEMEALMGVKEMYWGGDWNESGCRLASLHTYPRVEVWQAILDRSVLDGLVLLVISSQPEPTLTG